MMIKEWYVDYMILYPRKQKQEEGNKSKTLNLT